MSDYRYFELGLSALLSFLPFALLILYPVRDQLRWKRPAVSFALFLFYLISFIKTYMTATDQSIFALSILVFFIEGCFLFYLSMENIGKTAFLLLVIYDLAFSIRGLAKICECMIFPVLSFQKYRWSYSLCLAVLEIIILLPLFYYVKNVYVPISKDITNNRIWRFLWVIPATFYVIRYYYGFFHVVAFHSNELSLNMALMQTIITVSTFYVYHSIICYVREQTNNLILMEENTSYQLQLAQFSMIPEQIEEVRRTQHDLKHHMNVIHSFIIEDEKKEALEYIEAYEKQYLSSKLEHFCENVVVNNLLQHYHRRAKESGITFTSRVSLPAVIPVSKGDLSVLFGNLLENSLEACEQDGGDGQVTVKASIRGDFLSLHIANTCHGAYTQDDQGNVISSKDDLSAHGIGLRSVSRIVQNYDGLMEISFEDEIFNCHIQMMLTHH